MASIIVAVDENNGIGFNGELLEHIPEDMKRFKKLTIEGGYVMMGRKTYASLPQKPLPDRRNYIITTHPTPYTPTDQIQTIDMDEAKHLIQLTDNTYMERCLFIIGGGQIYKELLPYCKDIYMTKILKSHDNVDTYFPEIKDAEWLRFLEHEGEYKGIRYQFWHLRRLS